MQYSIIPPSSINTTISLPASKSICNRALVINALAKGTRMPDNLSDCDDTQVIVKALNEMPPHDRYQSCRNSHAFYDSLLSRDSRRAHDNRH